MAAHAYLPAFMRLVPPARSDGLSSGAGQPPWPSVVAALVLGIICLLFSFGPAAMMVTHSLVGCPPTCAARRQAIWRADRKRAGSARAGRRGRRSLDRGVPVLGESPALATASPQKQSGAGFRAKLAFLFRRRRSVVKHHGAMRLEGKHAEQHARSGIRIVELDRATLLLRPQPVRQSILGPRDRSAIKGLRNIRKLVAVERMTR